MQVHIGPDEAPLTVQPAPLEECTVSVCEEQQSAFQKVKNILAPLTMISPVKGLVLTLYLTSTDKFIGAMLA